MGQCDNLAAALRKARETIVAAISANCELPDFDPAEHVTVRAIDAALSEYEAAAAAPSDYGELVKRLHDHDFDAPICQEAADAIEQQARDIAALRIAMVTRDKIAAAREGALRNSGNMVRELNDLCKAYEHELVIRGISLPGEPNTRGTDTPEQEGMSR